MAIFDGLEEAIDTIDIRLESSLVDEMQPIPLTWTLLEFTGDQARLQLNTNEISNEQSTDAYDDLEISFNDAGGIFRTEDGKGISIGETISWHLQPIVDT